MDATETSEFTTIRIKTILKDKIDRELGRLWNVTGKRPTVDDVVSLAWEAYEVSKDDD